MICSDTSFSMILFQAEDCIRYYKVTGVQTCALPIFTRHVHLPARFAVDLNDEIQSLVRNERGVECGPPRVEDTFGMAKPFPQLFGNVQIGRASCRECVSH